MTINPLYSRSRSHSRRGLAVTPDKVRDADHRYYQTWADFAPALEALAVDNESVPEFLRKQVVRAWSLPRQQPKNANTAFSTLDAEVNNCLAAAANRLRSLGFGYPPQALILGAVGRQQKRFLG